MSIPPEPPQETTHEAIARISERYGVPLEEAEAVVTDRPLAPGEPHPMTIGTLMKEEQSKGITMNQTQKRWTPLSVAGTLLGILGILATLTLLVFLLWGRNEPRKEKEILELKDTTATTGEITAATPRLDSLPVGDTTAIMAAPLPLPAPRPAARPRRHIPRAVLSTSNSIEAEERLAELRAGGNTKAKIRRVERGGTTIYEVRR